MQNGKPYSALDKLKSQSSGEHVWTIETPCLNLTFRRMDAGEVQLTSLITAGREWIASPTPMFGLLDDTHAGIELQDATGVFEGSTYRLRGTLRPTGITASIAWNVYEEESVVVAEIEIVNETDHAFEIGNLTSLCLNLREDQGQFGALAGGRWDETMPPRGYKLETTDLDEIGRGKSIGAAEDGRSSGEHVPWFALMHPDGGLLASLVWSGRWGLNISRNIEWCSLAFGISDFGHRLLPGQKIALPGVALAGYAGDLDDGANAWRKWVAEHWMPSLPDTWPWVQYNHWYAWYGDIDGGRLLNEAHHAAKAGCEVFVIDDGWFRGRRPESYSAGWGDWVEDRSKFPEGLRAFGAGIRELGMKFGLWVEPERADDNGDLVREHPDWVATRQSKPIARRGPDGDEGVHLCLGNPEVRQWMIADMIRVVRDYGVDWLKWDYNIGYGLGCDAEDHGHQARDGHHAHTLGLYVVFEALRAACPNLMIENCASGGHRVDLGTLRHTHTNWISDYTHRAASCRQHVQGAGLFLPLPHLNTWALADRSATEFRSRMGGAFGISSFMEKWTEDERVTFRTAVEEYTRLRPYLSGKRFLLTGPLHQDWEVWQFVHPNGRDSAILAFREAGRVVEIRVQPRALSADTRFLVQRPGSVVDVQQTGAVLNSAGISMLLPETQSSELVWLTALD